MNLKEIKKNIIHKKMKNRRKKVNMNGDKTIVDKDTYTMDLIKNSRIAPIIESSES
jgi:hypothetical protein